MQAIMISNYQHNVTGTSRRVYAGFLNNRPRYCKYLWGFACFRGLYKKFFSQVPLFLFSGVFLKLFLYRPLLRIKKQVTLDFRYPATYFFRIDPQKFEISSERTDFTKKIFCYTNRFYLFKIMFNYFLNNLRR